MIFDIVQEWALCREAMLAAIAETKGTHTEDDILTGLVTGSYKLWRKNGSGIVTDFAVYPRMKVINVFLAGGSLKDILPLQTEVENYGRKMGCQRATLLAVRDGWQRAVAGGQKLGICMYKDL